MKENKINLDLFLEIEVKDTNGKIIFKRRMESKSLVTGFMGLLRAFFNSSSSVKDTSGTYRTALGGIAGGVSPYRYYHAMNLNAEVSNDAYGIQVGTSPTGVTNTDYKLGTKIVQGSGTGQLLHNASTVEDVAGVAPISSIRVIRTFSNSSGGTITVKEVGIVAYNGISNSSQFSYLIVRDTTGDIAVGNGQTLTVRYLFYVTA